MFTNLAGKRTKTRFCITGAEGECEQSDVDGGMYEVATITTDRCTILLTKEQGNVKKRKNPVTAGMAQVETLTKHSAAASVMRYTGGAPSLKANSLQLFYNNYPPKLVKRAIMEAIYF